MPKIEESEVSTAEDGDEQIDKLQERIMAKSMKAAPKPEPKPEPKKDQVREIATVKKPLCVYKVKKQWTGSVSGQVHTLHVGKVLDPKLYGGAPGIERLKVLGLELEEVE